MATFSLHIAIDPSKAKWTAIAEGVRSAITAGRLKPGEVLPSSRVIARQTQTHRQTVMTAMEELVAEGWIVGEPRSCYRVNAKLPIAAQPKTWTMRGTASERHLYRWRPAGSSQRSSWAGRVRDPASHPELKTRVVMQSGQPDLRLFPIEEFRRCMSRAMRDCRERDLTWGAPEGSPALIRSISDWLRMERALTGRSILVTNGSQEAIDLTSRVLLTAGDAVAVENPGYPPAWSCFSNAGARLCPIPVDHEGMDPDYLRRLLRNRKVKLIYLTPLHQYPTTATLPVDRRMAIYALAAEHHVPVFEDDFDHEFHYASQPVAPMASMDPCGLILYSSSFTKLMFPSLRLGFLALPMGAVPAFRATKDETSRHTSTLIQNALADWMESGGFARHVRRMTRVYEQRLTAVDDGLQRLKSEGHRLQWRKPSGGMALWVETRFPAEQLCKAALSQGLFVHSGQAFQMGNHLPSRAVRMGFACLSEDRLRLALTLLERALIQCGSRIKG